ncbi:hypothetical protein BGZ76_004770 [Entomortierella beljakovae]|nr:hypothetical protein BGZ76_004770 [Entomortierella beljakovae]
MQSVGSFFSSVTKFYSEINPATLSGAIDVVVIEQPNGDLACSPFHVRFGKLSILRPQEKVVEVTINGRTVDFPMKVGDAGEAFFVFETEQDVPEEFATSPLARPSEYKTGEEDIDFLDLSQGGNGVRNNNDNNNSAPLHEDQDAGYVSAHSGHGSEFEEDDQTSFSPGLGNGQVEAFRSVTIKGRLSISVSLPSSPMLNGRDIMENFQPIDSAGPFDDTQSDKPHDVIPLGSSVKRDSIEKPHTDQVIMDMTGYKTDDSGDTDLDSDGPSILDWTNRRMRKKRGKFKKSNLGMNKFDEVFEPTVSDEWKSDPRLPSKPTMKLRSRVNSKSNLRKRSLSLPNLKEPGYVSASSFQKTRFGNNIHSGASKNSAASSTSHETTKHQSRNEAKNTITRRSIKSSELKHGQQSVQKSNLALSALSDTELEYQTPRSAKSMQDPEWSWGWGSLPVKNEGLDGNEERAEHVSIDFSPHQKPVLNEMEIEGATYRVAISLCPGDDFGKDLVASEALFAMNQVSFDEFSKDPLKILNNKSLVCLINDRYFTWAAAGPYLASLVLFKKPLSDETLHQLSMKDSRHLSERLPTQQAPTRFGVISRWFRGSQATNQPDSTEQSPLQSPFDTSSPLAPGDERTNGKVAKEKGDKVVFLPQHPNVDSVSRSISMPVNGTKPGSITTETGEQKHTAQAPKTNKRYAKTLRLTSEQLKSLNLKKGANTLTFSVTSSYQGKAICSAKLFLWDHDFQVVISDIDGTITKSDALGHIFTMAGKDWTHTGVAKLYTDIVNNGYHILYLTSRAIGQADYTRKYLKNVEQDNYQLPDGPVIMSPDRLMTAFHREVILRKPEEFKMACLRDIKRLFGDRNPFYAGFGNRITDALSYRSVGVASSHIFSIDPTGEVKLELLSTFKSSYLALNDLVHEIFPGNRHVPEFNDWNYWKPALPIIDLPMAPSLQPSLPLTPIDFSASGGGSINGGSSRLGVIRSLTSSFASAGSLKKRPSIPTFNSSPSSTPPLPPGQTSPRSLTPLSMAAVPPSTGPPMSSPAGLQIADRTRRLSLSIMKYGSSAVSPPLSTSPTNSSTIDKNTVSEAGPLGSFRARARGMSMSSNGYVPSNLGTSPPTSFGSSESSSDIIHPLDIQAGKKSHGFSVSPPQIASRISETVIPFLRGRSSKSDQGQEQTQELPREFEQGYGAEDGYREEQVKYDQYGNEFEFEYDGQGDEDGIEYEDEYGEDNLDEDDDDDVELDIDAPFL